MRKTSFAPIGGFIKRLVIFLLFLAICGFFLLYITCYIWIKTDINKICRDFQPKYEGDRVEMMISVLANENESLRHKNMAIWVLEYIGDERALPYLQKLYIHKPCDHLSYVCQREVKRAIDHIQGKRVTLIFFRKSR